ncbi:OLC1v1022649C1 [Oldenlandia corymbosa var. corymbosa]|uniref:OLC1v1022649C1 n=1 Tax=Oldenlandia corymbosa var. corymbosa TaxID=529605 RepID=A0AAV1C0X4_OLDCO|nr:OLC1v1022649C1 [Oldenlandia corymbosa var. corymbosa]
MRRRFETTISSAWNTTIEIWLSMVNRLILLHHSPRGSPRYLVWNPMSKESIWLPRLRPGLQVDFIEQALLSSSSSLVLIFMGEFPLILYCHVGDKEWSEFNYAQSIEAQTGTPLPQTYHLCGAVDFNGAIYATSSCYRDLVQINIDDNNNCETLLLMPEEDRARHLFNRFLQIFSRSYRTFLVSLGGHHLCLILMLPRYYDRYEEELSVSIFRFDFSTNSWQQKTSLNGGAVFLCHDYCLYSSQGGAPLDVVGSNGNKWSYIYFNLQNGQTLFSYRVEDEKLTSYSLCPPMAEDDWISHWIMPPAIPLDVHKLSTTFTYPSNHQQQQDAHDCSSVVFGGMAYFWRRSATTTKWRLLMKQHGSVTVIHDGGNSSLCDLSPEVLGLIAENLCFVDYMHFRLVNKLCASSTIRMRLNPFPPCLIYKDRNSHVYKILDSDLNQKLCVKIPHVLKDYMIRCSANGWLLLENDRDLFFFNPLRMQALRAGYAPMREHGVLNYTFIKKPSSSSDCSILALFNYGNGAGSYSTKYISDPIWRSFMVQGQGFEQFFNKGCNSPVVVDGFCYHLGVNGMLRRGQLTQDKKSIFHWEIFENLIYPNINSFRRNYLIECGGELVSVLVDDDKDDQGKRPWVRVFKLRDHKEWVETDTLEGYSLY